MLEFAPMLFELAVDDELTMFNELSLLLESIFEGAFNSLLLEILLELDFLLEAFFDEALLDDLTIELFLLELFTELLIKLDFLLNELFTLELFLLLLEILLELDFFDDELLDELAANGVSITHALSVTSFPSTVTVVFPLSSIVTLIFHY